MTAVALEAEPVPLVRDAAGRLMVAGTRVPLDTLVAAFKQGESPEAIHENYDTVALADIYSILGYYLGHRPAVEAYLAEQERLGEELQARIEAAVRPDDLRAKLMARSERVTVRLVADENLRRAIVVGCSVR